MASKRLTRKEIVQEDRIHATLIKLYEWGTANRKWIVAGLAVVLLAILGSFLWQNYRQGRAEQVQREFAEALEVFHAPLATDPAPQEDGTSKFRFKSTQERHQEALKRFNAIAENYSSQKLGLLARHYVALNQQELGQKEEARKTMLEVIDEADNAEVKNLARYFLAQQARANNNLQEANKFLQAILKEESDSFPKQTVLFELAQTYEAQDNTAEALKQYKRVTSEYPMSPQSNQAQERITQLEMAK